MAARHGVFHNGNPNLIGASHGSLENKPIAMNFTLGIP
jgi:hypothetical protein